MLQAFVQNVSFVSRRMLQSFFYLDVAYVLTHMLQQYVTNVSVVLVLCRILYVAFECFTLQVQTAGVGVYEGGQDQAVAKRHKARGAVVEEAGESLPSGLEETSAASLWKRRG
jgi:hypothetical protein